MTTSESRPVTVSRSVPRVAAALLRLNRPDGRRPRARLDGDGSTWGVSPLPEDRASDARAASGLRAPARTGLGYLPRATLLADVATVTAVVILAALLHDALPLFPPADQSAHAWAVALPLVSAWIALIAVTGGYRERLFGSGMDEYKIVLNATFVAAGLTAALSYLSEYDLSRGLYVLVFAVGPLALLAERRVLRRGLHRARRAGRLTHDVVIAGTPATIHAVAQVLSRENWLGYRVLGALVPTRLSREEAVGGTPVLGTVDQAREVVRTSNADVIFVADGALEGAEEMRELVWDLEESNVQVVVAPSVTDVSRERVRVRPVGGLPMVHIDRPRHVNAGRRLKRAFDLAVSACLLTAVIPLLLAIAAWIKLNDGGPVFFRQVRTGRHGEEFDCLKFRTMVVDAEAQLAALHAEQGFIGVGLFKMKQDPRVTRPGRWLRRYSLDEVPQFINVLRGDMSLVGPRPPLPTEVATYDRTTRRRLHVRPGITGLWQVSGRSDLSWDEAVRLDVYYVDNWSMLQDLTILARTFGAVVGSRGAY